MKTTLTRTRYNVRFVGGFVVVGLGLTGLYLNLAYGAVNWVGVLTGCLGVLFGVIAVITSGPG